MLALPLVATGPACLAAGGREIVADAPGPIPGLDARRVVVPGGEIAGHAVEVSEVSSRLDPSEALARVERHWREGDLAVVLRADSGGWSVLSRRTARGYDTLQLRAAARGGAEGLLTQWRERAGSTTLPAGLLDLLPDDAQVVRQLTSRDGADGGSRTTDTLIGRLAHSIDEAELRIERHLGRKGFVAVSTPGAPRDLAWRNDRARFFRAAGVELLVTLHAQPQGTGVVLYHVRATR
jgi:hypothetical protein